jgi:hypothetical protein
MRKFVSKRSALIAVVGALVVSTAAIAYWTQGGSGTGSGTAGSTTGITVNQTSAPSSDLWPGGPAVALSGNFDNPNAGGVVIASVTAVVSSVTNGGTGLGACTPADFAIGGSAAGSTVPAGTGTGAWSGLTLELLNTASNQDKCKNATANITYTANAL